MRDGITVYSAEKRGLRMAGFGRPFRTKPLQINQGV